MKGHYQVDKNGLPVLNPDVNLPKGIYYDDLGFKVNRSGFLVDQAGNVVDDRGNVVFKKTMLEEGKLPAVFDINRPKNAGHLTVNVKPKVCQQILMPKLDL